MRIVSGHYGGRRLEPPKGRDVRPTSDKIRGAIFNALLSRIDIDSARVLDLFCGSGALGLEALSRGAAHCLFTDKAKSSIDLAKHNARALSVPADHRDYRLMDTTKIIDNWLNARANLAFLDPPYHKDLIQPCLQGLHDGGWLANGAICVIETEGEFDLSQLNDDKIPFVHDGEKSYGTTKISYFVYHP